jgi:aminoglycoside 6'-N-acetyltransferase
VVDSDLSFIPLTRDDFPRVVEWLARPHVARWWHEPQGYEAFEREYGPCLDGSDPTLVFICALGSTPVGFVQIYRVDDEPRYKTAVGVDDAAGLDLFVSDADRTNFGLGTRIIGRAVELIWTSYPDVRRAMASPSVHNARSIRAFEKCGFVAQGAVTVPGEVDDEMVMVCERFTTA